MKYTVLFSSLFLLLAVGCTGDKAAGKTTPETDPVAGNTGKVDPGTPKEVAPAGPSSDLCTDTQCPGVVH